MRGRRDDVAHTAYPPGKDRDPVLSPGRLWTVEEANERLVELREMLHEMRGYVARLRKLHEELARLAAFWGKELDSPDHPDKALKDRLQTEWETLKAKVERRVHNLHDEGIELKDVDSGLVDFYGLVDDTLAFLCWQQGEEEVAFYHALGGGFRTRKPLPDHPRAR
jgi:hypothetical protein